MAQEKSGLFQAVQRRVTVANNRKAKAAQDIADLEKRLACARAEHSSAMEM